MAVRLQKVNKEAEKVLSYDERTTEIHRMRNVTATVIPVIIGATGTISQSYST